MGTREVGTGEGGVVVPIRTDADIAEAHKAKIIEAMMPLLAAMDAARRDGFVVSFNLAPDAMGRQVIQVLKLIKEF